MSSRNSGRCTYTAFPTTGSSIPEHQTLTVLRHSEPAYLRVLDAGVGDVIRAEPFEAVELSVAELFGGDF